MLIKVLKIGGLSVLGLVTLVITLGLIFGENPDQQANQTPRPPAVENQSLESQQQVSKEGALSTEASGAPTKTENQLNTNTQNNQVAQNNTKEVLWCIAQRINSFNNVQLLLFWDYLAKNTSALTSETTLIALMSQKLGCPKLVIITPATPEDLEQNWKTIKTFSGNGSQELEKVNIPDPKWRFKIVWSGTPEGVSSELWGIWQNIDDDPRYPAWALWIPAFYGPKADMRTFPQFEENESRTGNFKLRTEAVSSTQWQIEIQIFSPTN